MINSQRENYSTVSFSINVLYITLRIFEPMEKDYQKLCDRVDFTYFLAIHSFYDPGRGYGNFEFDFFNESTLIPRTEEIEERILRSRSKKGMNTSGTSNFFQFYNIWLKMAMAFPNPKICRKKVIWF